MGAAAGDDGRRRKTDKVVPKRIPHTPKPERPKPLRALPFFRDPAHTRPTKWSLYRPLLRALGGAAALAAARSATASSPLLPSSPPASSSGASSDPSSTDASASDSQSSSPSRSSTPTDSPSSTPTPPSRPTIPASRVLQGSSWLAAFQGTERASPATAKAAARPAGFAPLPPLSGTYPHLLASLRARWRTARGWTSMPDTRAFILHEEDLLASLRSSSPILAKQESALATSYAAYLATPPPPPPPRPLLTGGFMRPTKYSPPLPRMKPQPHHITMLIADRHKRRERRIHRLKWAKERQREMRAEVQFWRDVGIEQVDGGAWGPGKGERSWNAPLTAQIDELETLLGNDARREQAVFPDDVIERVKAARRRRDTWRVNKSRKERGLPPLYRGPPPRWQPMAGQVAPERAASVGESKGEPDASVESTKTSRSTFVNTSLSDSHFAEYAAVLEAEEAGSFGEPGRPRKPTPSSIPTAAEVAARTPQRRERPGKGKP